MTLLFFLTDLKQSVQYLLDLINEFGMVSGYTINWQKSDLLSLTTDLDPSFVTSTQLNIAKYLGVKLTKKTINYFLNITSWRD